MTTSLRTLCLVVAAVGLANETAQAQSLWRNRLPHRENLFADTSARRKGDLLTIVVRENTDVTNRDSRSLKKGSNSDAGFNFNSGSGGDFGISAANMNARNTTDSKREFDGSSAFSSARVFSDRVTVTVLDVFPNGNMLVAGRRRQLVEGDSRTLVVSGIVRWSDISPDNTIESRYVANLNMHYEGRGAESKFVNQGWLARGVNKVWPF